MFDWHMKHTHGAEIPCPKCNFVARNELNLKSVPRAAAAAAALRLAATVTANSY